MKFGACDFLRNSDKLGLVSIDKNLSKVGSL